ncbi:MAG: hypothetical protein KDK39_19470, partial [Leptospiraceae bacterium]|nr:hypothetical protein [Leptospiraceae bacterium]
DRQHINRCKRCQRQLQHLECGLQQPDAGWQKQASLGQKKRSSARLKSGAWNKKKMRRKTPD